VKCSEKVDLQLPGLFLKVHIPHCVAGQALSASCVACGDCTRLVHEYNLGLTMAVTCTGLCQQWYVPGYGSSCMTIGMVHAITYSSRSKAVGMVHDVTYASFSKTIGPVQDIGYGSYSKAIGPVQARLCRCGTQATHSKPSTSNSKTENYSVPRPCCSIG